MKENAETKCRLCGAPGSEMQAFSGVQAVSYLFCNACGFIGLASAHFLPKEQERQRYLLHSNSASDSGYLDYLRSFIEQAIAPFVPRGSRVLDFGSGPSPVLSAELSQAGFECESYDPFFRPDPSWRTRQYRAVVLHEVVEHIHDPAQTLLDIVPRLESGGILAIRTRFPPAAPDAFLSWWYRMDSTHVGFFTPASLERLFRPLGILKVVCIQPDIIVLGRT